MKPVCKDCTHFKNQVCTKDQKNGYGQCKKFKAIPIPDLIKERNKLLLSQDNAERLEYLTKKISDFNGGPI